MGWFDNFFYGKKCLYAIVGCTKVLILLYAYGVLYYSRWVFLKSKKNLRLVFSCKWEKVNVKIINAEEMYDSNKDLYKTIMGWNWMEKLFGLFVSVIHYLIYPLLNLPWSKLKRELLHLHWNKKSLDEKWK